MINSVPPVNVLLLEPYMTGSHAAWAQDLQKYSRHRIKILCQKGQFWKWRMHGGAITLARKCREQDFQFDLLLASDMLDLTTFLALTRRQTAHIPAAVYFHENQLCYPWSPGDRDVIEKRDRHYGFINISSALAADRVLFNSRYHMDAFLSESRKFLNFFPDDREPETVDRIRQKCEVLHLALDLRRLDTHARTNKSGKPLILWNHRWEYDKNPADFFKALEILANEGMDFDVAVLGERFSKNPPAFDKARQALGPRIVQFGFVDDQKEYAGWLWRSDILPVTSVQDFFGAGVMEAVYCGCFPILPNRLAYPELLPEEWHEACLYNNFKNLLRLLRKCLKNIEYYRKINLTFARDYCWQQKIGDYDRCIKKLYQASQESRVS